MECHVWVYILAADVISDQVLCGLSYQFVKDL